MTASVLAQLTALKGLPTPDLKRRWRELFGTEPPPYNRRFLESRLAYRIQELAYGGLNPKTVDRLEALAEDLVDGDRGKRHRLVKDRPIAGTRLIREWQGVEHCVTVRHEGYEYQGRPYKSLSAIARAITGTRWSGPLFFGLRQRGGRKLMLAPSGTEISPMPGRRVDNALVRAIARAHRWKRLLESGTYSSITELAEAEKINQSYLCRVLRLTLLAPDVVEGALNGTLSPKFTLERAMKPVPIVWEDQRRVLRV